MFLPNYTASHTTRQYP